MCGILGTIGGKIRLGSFIYSLELLNTRGEEATGLTGFSNGFISEKCQGTAKNLGKNLPDFNDLLDMCIGSTRYPTIGSVKKESLYKHLAPFTESTTKGLLSLAFNGNIIYPRINEEGNDGVILTKLLKNFIDTNYTIYEAIEQLLQHVDGAYSVVAILGDDELIAFRDPFGIRPLCWGELEEGGYVVTSETRVLEKLGVKEYHFIPPGSLFVFKKSSFEKHRINYQKHKHCMFEWTYFSQAPSINEGKEVYRIRYKLGQILGNLLQEKGIKNIDYVIPVPNTSRSAAMGCADHLNLKYADGLIKNRVGRIFIKPTEMERDEAVKNVYETVNSVISGKNIILIDDSIVRGTTLSRVIELLRKKGVNSIHVGITTPKIQYPCCYGIDMSRPGELLAANKDEKTLAFILGCDSLTYMSLKGLYDGIELKGLCTACLNGNYPTEKGKFLIKQISSLNEEDRCYEQSFISR